jgi:hypothetical protein
MKLEELKNGDRIRVWVFDWIEVEYRDVHDTPFKLYAGLNKDGFLERWLNISLINSIYEAEYSDCKNPIGHGWDPITTKN